MGKYIIEVGDAYAEYICGKGDMLCLPVRINEFEDNWLNTNIPLTPYTEPDTEKVRKEAYRQGYDTGYGTKVNEFYEQGLADAWDAARKIVTMPDREFINSDILELDPGESIFTKYTASEAIEKIRQYEQEKDRQARIEYNFDEIKDVLNTTMKEYNVSLDEIAEVLAKMKEESNEA